MKIPDTIPVRGCGWHRYDAEFSSLKDDRVGMTGSVFSDGNERVGFRLVRRVEPQK